MAVMCIAAQKKSLARMDSAYFTTTPCLSNGSNLYCSYSPYTAEAKQVFRHTHTHSQDALTRTNEILRWIHVSYAV